MDENNQRIEQINKQIEEMQSVYDRDVNNGVQETDQIQQNRKKRIEQLNGELKDVELGKLDSLKNRKQEIEGILKRKESLNKDKEQIEKAISEIEGKSEIKDGKLVKPQELTEYEGDLDRINTELASFEKYETELENINKEIGNLTDKYPYSKNEYGNHEIKLSDNKTIFLSDVEKNDTRNVDDMKGYMCAIYENGELITDKTIYLDQELDFEKINEDKGYADVVKDFLSPDRIEKYSKEAEGKGVVDSVYIGHIVPDSENSFGYKKRRYIGEPENEIYNKISKQEYKSASVLHDYLVENAKKGNITNQETLTKQIKDYENKLESIRKQRPDLYDKVIQTEPQQKIENQNKVSEPTKVVNIPDEVMHGNPQKAMENENIRAGAPVGQKVGNRLDGQRYQPTRDTYNEQPNVEEQETEEQSLTVVPERKGFINWVKEKFNSIKEFFSKNKSNDIELDETGQAWQDYIDAQEGNENKTETSKRESFVNSITMNNKLKNQEQQKKAFEAVKKWEQQNKNAIEQETDDREP